jgi:3-isopropylmalate/(R)-2-methylmalate dehydratase small subunit
MTPLISVEGCAAPLLQANIDTDAIIPSREMTRVSKSGLADGLFAGWRYRSIGSRERNMDFVLNQTKYQSCCILLTGANFGCGSSREHAVWALHEFGIRAVLAPSFAPIFEANCVRNGIAPVQLTEAQIAQLADWVSVDPAGRPVRVDIAARTVSAGTVFNASFSLDPEAVEMLLTGRDVIDLTLERRADIEAFLARDQPARPWIYLS